MFAHTIMPKQFANASYISAIHVSDVHYREDLLAPMHLTKSVAKFQAVEQLPKRVNTFFLRWIACLLPFSSIVDEQSCFH